MTTGRVHLSQCPPNNQCTGFKAWNAIALNRSHKHIVMSNVFLLPVPRHQVGKYLKRQYKRALRVDYNAGALDRWKSNWYKSLCWSWIILFSLVDIQNIHVASTNSQDNQLQAWKPAKQQNRPRTSVSTSGKSSGKLIMANMSELKFCFERGTFKQAVEIMQVVKKRWKRHPA